MPQAKSTIFIVGGALLLSFFAVWQPAAALIVMGFLALLFFSYLFPGASFLALVFYWSLQVALNPVSGIDLASGRAILLIFSLGWLASVAAKGGLRRIASPTFFIWGALLVTALTSTIFGVNPLWGLRKAALWVNLTPLLIFVPVIMKSRKEIRALLLAAGGGVFVSVLVGLGQFVSQFWLGALRVKEVWARVVPALFGRSFGEAILGFSSWLVDIEGRLYFRAIGMFPDPHMFAFSIGLFLTVVVFLLLQEPRLQRWRGLALAIVLILLSGLAVSFSRGGYVGLWGSAAFIMIILWQRDKLRGYYKPILASVLLFTVLLAPFWGRVTSIFNVGEGANSARLALWGEGLRIIKESHFMGVGLGNSPLAVSSEANYRVPIYFHNTYLDIGVELGLLGIILWIFMVGYLVWRLVRTRDIVALGLAGALVWFSVHSLFETAIFSPRILGLLLVIMGAGESIIKMQNVSLKMKNSPFDG